MTHNDEQDMRDMLSVIAQTLSADWHIKQDKETLLNVPIENPSPASKNTP